MKASTEGKGEGEGWGGYWGVFQMDHNTGKLFRTARICLLHFILAGLTGSLRTEVVSVGACRGG